MPLPASRRPASCRPPKTLDDLDIERRILESRQRVYAHLRLEAQIEAARLARTTPATDTVRNS